MDGALKQLIQAANPSTGFGSLPQPMPGASVTQMGLVRAQAPGGELLTYLQSDKLVWFEQLYRKLPPAGMYGATPVKPVTFTMGAFTVPPSMVLVILDYAFNIYRFSGAAAGDFLPIETNRLSTQVGWDITIDANRPGNTKFQIIPSIPTQTQQAFAPNQNRPGNPPQQWQFDLVRAAQSQGPAGPALAMMPQRHHRPGLVQVANNYVARSGNTLEVACSVINRIPIPIGFFEADVFGLLMPQNVYDAYQSANIPVGDAIVPKIPAST